jgi:anti-sigma factor (TIGR02949 family)
MSFSERLKRLLWGGEAPTPTSREEEESHPAVRAITCMEALERVQEYLDGELDHVSHEEVTQHFDKCKRCYPHLRLEERFRDLLHRSQKKEACPEHLKEQILELLAAEAGPPE